jgi:beta-lactamase regulating signal transducer with metallopeptidase domain
MKSIWFIASLMVLLSQTVKAQMPVLTDFLLYTRLDTAYWYTDFEKLNAEYSRVANQCQTCISSGSDTTRTRSCFNTSTAHVRLDTAFHNITSEMLIGVWRVVNAGVFAVTDSLAFNAREYIRVKKVIDDQSDAQGQITFTKKVMKPNIRTKKRLLKKRKRYAIVEGRHLMTKKLVGMCGPTMIGITDEGLLIMDIHRYKRNAKRDEYDVFTTYVNRTILERIE